MLPVTATNTQRRSQGVGAIWFRRLLKPSQWDWEYTFWTIAQLLVSPKTVYRQTSYHKQTKDHWARDDPGFVAVTAAAVAVLAFIYGLIFADSFWHALSKAFSAVAVDYLGLGCCIATVLWVIANRLHRRAVHPHSAQTDMSVEWVFAFDVHCNAVIPIVTLGIVQLVLSPILLLDSRPAAALSALLYSAALSHYCYILFLGFAALPYLERPETFLYPLAGIVVVLLGTLLIGWNPTKTFLRLYFQYN